MNIPKNWVYSSPCQPNPQKLRRCYTRKWVNSVPSPGHPRGRPAARFPRPAAPMARHSADFSWGARFCTLSSGTATNATGTAANVTEAGATRFGNVCCTGTATWNGGGMGDPDALVGTAEVEWFFWRVGKNYATAVPQGPKPFHAGPVALNAEGACPP